MNRRTDGQEFGPGERIAAFAKATELYAESLEDPDLANVYWGKSLGLWQALWILSAEGRTAQPRQLQVPSVTAPPFGPLRNRRAPGFVSFATNQDGSSVGGVMSFGGSDNEAEAHVPRSSHG